MRGIYRQASGFVQGIIQQVLAELSVTVIRWVAGIGVLSGAGAFGISLGLVFSPDPAQDDPAGLMGTAIIQDTYMFGGPFDVEQYRPELSFDRDALQDVPAKYLSPQEFGDALLRMFDEHAPN